MKYTKKIAAAVLALLIGFSLLGCTANSLPEGFGAEQVTQKAADIVKLSTDGDYDAIIAILRDDLKSQISTDQLRDGWAPTCEKAGAFVEITKTVLSGTADKTTGEEYAVAQVLVKHTDANLLYTLSFDKNLALVGLYLK
jgi:hypothetical protein